MSEERRGPFQKCDQCRDRTLRKGAYHFCKPHRASSLCQSPNRSRSRTAQIRISMRTQRYPDIMKMNVRNRKRSSLPASDVSVASSPGAGAGTDNAPRQATSQAITETAARIGARVRSLRKSRKLSIDNLSRRARVSVGMISQIERGITNPSVRIMEQLRRVLAVPLSSLLESDTADDLTPTDSEFIRRATARPTFRVGEMTKELLSPHGEHGLQMLVIVLPAGASSADVIIGPGEKAGLVLSGSIVLRVAERQAKLVAGDSFQFRSTLPHSVHNEGAEEAKLLWIINTTTSRPPL